MSSEIRSHQGNKEVRMSLVLWNDFGRLEGLGLPMGGPLNQVVGMSGGDAGEWAWTPAVDIFETPDHDLVVSAELPGVRPEAVEVTLEENTLTIAGDRRFDSAGEGRWYRTERQFGAFRRSFKLPRSVDFGAVSAEHKDGTLQVRLPLRQEARPHRVAVKAV